MTGELELRLTPAPGGVVATLRDAVRPADWRPAPASPRWVERPAPASIDDAVAAWAQHTGDVRLSFPPLPASVELTALLLELRAKREDALLVLRQPRAIDLGRPLSLPLECGSLLGAPPLRFDDFTRDAAEPTLLVREAVVQGDQPPPHVLHLTPGPGLNLARLVEDLRSSGHVPRLIVVAIPDQAEKHVALGEALALLAETGCRAILAFTAEPPHRDEAEAWLYRALAHDRPIDEIARALIGGGAKVGLALADDAECDVSLRRAVVERARHGLARDGQPHDPRDRATSELAALAAEHLARTARALDEIEIQVGHLHFDNEYAAARELGEAHRAIENLLHDSRSVRDWVASQGKRGPRRGLESTVRGHEKSTGSPLPAAMPPRVLHAALCRNGHVFDGGVVAGEALTLDVDIRFVASIASAFTARIDPAVLERAFGDLPAIDVDFVVWASPSEVEVRCAAGAKRSLPRMGATQTVTFDVRMMPLPDGVGQAVRRLRVGAYHRNCLLQSLAIDVAVGRNAAPDQKLSNVLDYALSEELLTADAGPSRRMSIFINEAPDGSHWIGARGDKDEAPHEAPILLDQSVNALAETLHEKLRAASTIDGKIDRFAKPLAEATDNERALRGKSLIALARAGHRLFGHLFAKGGERASFEKRRQTLGPPDGHVEIARCKGDAPDLPWQLVYDLDLEIYDPDALRLCPSYVSQLDQKDNLLDRPADCAAQAACPHRKALAGQTVDASDADARTIVCPFGFWGARHRIAQPIALRKTGASPPRAAPSGDAGVTVGYYEFENAAEHVARIAPPNDARSATTTSKAALTGHLRARRDAILYLYCHGRTIDLAGFVLQIGEAKGAKQYVGTTDLLGIDLQHAPIVILNGCNTLQVQPSTLNDLLDALRTCGASAIIGPEIAMFTTSAARIGEALVAGVLEGIPLDALMVKIRRDLLREMSPMGLAYNVYAPSDLAWKPRS